MGVAGALLAGRKGAEGPPNAQEEEVLREGGPEASPSPRDLKRILGQYWPRGDLSSPALYFDRHGHP